MPCTNLDILQNALVIGSTSKELQKEGINGLSAAAKQDDCALFEKSMTFLT